MSCTCSEGIVQQNVHPSATSHVQGLLPGLDLVSWRAPGGPPPRRSALLQCRQQSCSARGQGTGPRALTAPSGGLDHACTPMETTCLLCGMCSVTTHARPTLGAQSVQTWSSPRLWGTPGGPHWGSPLGHVGRWRPAPPVAHSSPRRSDCAVTPAPGRAITVT